VPILTFLNIKGGVAKTTTAVAVSEALANLGHRVLLIDADHQCASSELLLGETRFLAADRQQRTLHDLLSAMLKEEFPSDGFRQYVAADAGNILALQPRLSVMPCSFRINDFSTNMAKARQGFRTNEEFQAIWKRRQSAFQTWLHKSYSYTIVARNAAGSSNPSGPVTGMAESERINFALEQVEMIYPGMREHFEGGVTKCWDEDEWARGASAFYKPGQVSSLLPHVARAEGRIYFAGEHTSVWGDGWMQGVLESGNSVAREVNEATGS
jgi:hypothetical protein